MFKKNHKSVSVRIALMLVLIAGVFWVMPARASADETNITASNPNFLNEDATLKLNGRTSGSFQADSWDVQLDPVRGPIFSPKNREPLSLLAATTLGNWSALGSNLAGTDGAINVVPFPSGAQILAIVVSGTDIYVGGCFTNASGDPTADMIAKWNGTSWSGLGNDGRIPADGAVQNCVRAIAVSGNDVYIGIGTASAARIGDYYNPLYTTIAKWDGATWSAVGGENSITSYVNSIAIVGSDVYVGGKFTDVKNGTTTLTAADYIAKWDGTNWSALGSNGLGDGALNGPQYIGGVEAITVNGTDIYVGGSFTAVDNGPTPVFNAAYIAKWNGIAWSGLGDDGIGGSSINGTVSAIATLGNNVYAAGSFTNVKNGAVTLTDADYVAKWDGTNWSALGSNGSGNGSLYAEVPNAFVTSIVASGGDVYVAGNINVNNNGVVLTAADYVAKWDGTNWSALGSNGSGNGSLNNGIYTLAKSGDKLYVGGVFRDVNNNGTVLNTADYIASYDSCSSSITVQNTNDSGAGSLRQAITDICAGGTVNFDSALSGHTIALTSTLVIDKDLTIDGSELTLPIIISGDTDNNGTGNVRVFTVNQDVNATLINLTITKGRQIYGGGVYNSGTLTITNGIFSGNSANTSGGGIYNNHLLTVTNGIFSGNSAFQDGGGIYGDGTMTVTNTTFSDNSAVADGGGIRSGGMLTVTNSIFSGNSAQSGGGIEHLGNLTVADSTFVSNTASFGGGIANSGASTIGNITNSTFSNNSAISGGGIMNSGVLTATNSTFYNNSASYGGGIRNDTYFSLILINSTFYGNSATASGGGIHNYNWGTLNYVNTIIANSTSGGDCVNLGTLGLNVNNLVEDGSCLASLSGDPNLGSLAQNGGPTQTLALLSNSLAINAGDDTNCPSTDQRGVKRPEGSHCDIGAYEYYDGNLSPGDTDRVSVDSSGTQGNGFSIESSISADGRYVAFDSGATNLVPNDTNGTSDVFLRDLQTGNTTRASVDSNGTQSNGASGNISISADGRYVAFYSDATNLVPNDTNGTGDIFIRDMQTGDAVRVSVDSSGTQSNGKSGFSSISADGRYVAFNSDATNLVPNDTNGTGDIFIHDMQTGDTVRISVDSGGAQANGASLNPFISASGRYIAFESAATNLISGDTNGKQDIFVHDMQTGLTTRVSVASNGTQTTDLSGSSSISADGRYVAFESAATNLVPGDTNDADDIFVHDLQTGNTMRVSVDSSGVQADRVSGNLYLAGGSSISADGRFIVFESIATNLVPNDTNGTGDIFIYDMQTGATTRVSVDSSGAQSTIGCSQFCYAWPPSISADGRYIAFMSYSPDLVQGDTNLAPDVFVHRQKSFPIISVMNSPVVYNGSPQAAIVTGSIAGTISNIRYDGSTTVPTNAGTYAVTANFTPSDTTNYNSLTNAPAGNFVINKLSINVIADAKTKSVGTTDPVLTFTSNPSLVNGDSFFGALTRASGETVGTYAIAQGTLNAGSNYTINFTGANLTITPSVVDMTSPTILSITRVNANPTSAASVNFTVVFSEVVTGVNIGAPFNDFALTTTGLTGASITDVSGSGTTYTVTVNTGSGNGTIRLDVVDDDSIKDAANNPLGGVGAGNGNFTSGEVYTINKSTTFGDVPSSHPYFSDIEILYANGYTGGCSTSPLNFCPNVSMSRAQAAVFMLRGNYGSSYAPPTVQHLFHDNWVNSSWGESWAEGMYKVGLTAGCLPSPLKFCPDEILTNVQVAVFGLRLKYGNAYSPPAGTGTVFADMTDTGFWGLGWAEQAYVDGLLPACGTSGGKPKICPDALVTRGFGASVIVKAKNLTMP